MIWKQQLDSKAILAGHLISANNGECAMVEEVACDVTSLVVELGKAYEILKLLTACGFTIGYDADGSCQFVRHEESKRRWYPAETT